MATSNQEGPISFAAGEDLTSYPLRFMLLSAAKTVTHNTVAGGICVGVTDDDVPGTIGQAVQMQQGPIIRVEAGAATAINLPVKSDNVGRAVEASEGVTDTSDGGAATDPLIGSHVQGLTLTAATAAGDIIEILTTIGAGAFPTTAA